MITCTEAVQRLWAYLDEELDGADQAEVDEHLAFCRRCCGEAEFADELRGMLRGAAIPHLPPDVEQRLEGTLRAIEEEPT